MPDVRTVPAKHIFLDVVGFTHQRSVEAQADIVGYLNEIVKRALTESGVSQDQLILLPTGDGMCIVLVDVPSPFDIHIRTALSILAGVHEHNRQMADAMRQFTVRVGINENIDNLVTDINERRNIAGAGINMAQRVMTFAEGDQIFVGTTVYETMSQREHYMSSFRAFTTTIKHGARLTAYQYIEDGHTGLNTEVPTAFRPKVPEAAPLSRTVAFYLAHVMMNRDFLAANTEGQGRYAGICLMWFLAEDAVAREEAPDYMKPTQKAPRCPTLDEQLAALTTPPFWAIADLASYIEDAELGRHRDCFDSRGGFPDVRFPNAVGVRRLEREHADIWRMYNLSDVEAPAV